MRKTVPHPIPDLPLFPELLSTQNTLLVYITHLRSYFHYTIFSQNTQVRLRYRVKFPIIFPEVMGNDSQGSGGRALYGDIEGAKYAPERTGEPVRHHAIHGV